MIVVHLRYGSDDPPVLPCYAWSSHSHSGLLGTAFSVHIGATFFSICSCRKYDISHWCTNITMVTWEVTEQSFKTEREKVKRSLTQILQVSTGGMNVFNERHSLIWYFDDGLDNWSKISDRGSIGDYEAYALCFIALSNSSNYSVTLQFSNLGFFTHSLRVFFSAPLYIQKIICRNCTSSIICHA